MIKTAEVVSEKDFSFSVCNCANELIFLKKRLKLQDALSTESI